MSLDHIVKLEIPFENSRQATIAQRTIEVDPVLKKQEISVTFSASENVLLARFAGVNDRVIRVAISSCIDNIKTIIETMDEFDGQNYQYTVFQGKIALDMNKAEDAIVKGTRGIAPGLVIAGMQHAEVDGSNRMGRTFGAMAVSGVKAAESVLNMLDLRRKQNETCYGSPLNA